MSNKTKNPPKSLCIPGINVPDENGELILYAHRGDLLDGIRNNAKLNLWRRDDFFLIQKFVRKADETTAEIRYKPTTKYSMWLDELVHEYLEIRVKCESDLSEVIVLDLDKLEEQCAREKGGSSGGKLAAEENIEAKNEDSNKNMQQEEEEVYYDVEYLEEYFDSDI